jgi:hypothetical protein
MASQRGGTNSNQRATWRSKRWDRRRVHAEVYRLHNTLCFGCVIGALVGLGWGKALLGWTRRSRRRLRDRNRRGVPLQLSLGSTNERP